LIQLYLGDCLEIMKEIPYASVDAVICDLPYGTTQCKWDAVIPFGSLWAKYRMVTKSAAAIVLTANQPFTSALVMSNIAEFKYAWVWDKVNGIRNHLNAKKQPMRCTEDVVVFYRSQPTYNPQMREGGYMSRKTKPGQSEGFGTVTGTDAGREITSLYPINLISIKSHDPNNSVHPTQKPVALMEYLIKTYTNESDTVLDNTMGSGTTGVACANLNRNFIGIEKDEKYFDIAEKRIREVAREIEVFRPEYAKSEFD
jgi:site-specific DNA-methyltransferase (adenine-specific)